MNNNIGKLAKQANTIRNQKLSKEHRRTIASIAAKARWDKYYSQPCAQCGVVLRYHKPPMVHHHFEKIPKS